MHRYFRGFRQEYWSLGLNIVSQGKPCFSFYWLISGPQLPRRFVAPDAGRFGVNLTLTCLFIVDVCLAKICIL